MDGDHDEVDAGDCRALGPRSPAPECQSRRVTDLQLSAGDTSFAVSPHNGGRFASLRVRDLELVGRGGPGLYHWGCYPMAPYAGRVRFGRLTWAGTRYQLPIQMPPHAIHGVTVDRPWQVLDASATSASLRCDFDIRWPWRGHAVQHLTLSGDRLDAVLEVHADDAPMPAWTGYHPWFARRLGRGEPVRIEFASAGKLPKDDDGMPTDALTPVPDGPYDDVFTDMTWPARLVWDDAIALSVSSPSPYAVIFDERPDGVCVEPQTAPPNAVELGLADTVEPGTPLVLQMTWTWADA
jgi:aldose 1-epimerase